MPLDADTARHHPRLQKAPDNAGQAFIANTAHSGEAGPPPEAALLCSEQAMPKHRRRDMRMSWLTRSKNFSKSKSTTVSYPSATYFWAGDASASPVLS
jgi:hypothetical protein